MKILAVNLLRLGDIIMCSGVLRGLKETHKNCELHLIVNKQFAEIVNLMPYIDKVYLFDRDRLQKGLGEFDEPLLGPYYHLENLISELNLEAYDSIINLSQNILSARLVGLVSAKNKIGLSVLSDGKSTFSSTWYERLNERKVGEPLHYVDYMVRGIGLPKSVYRPSLQTNENGVKEKTPTVVVQCLTSDVKKNWGLKNYEKAILQMANKRRELSFILIGSPSEETQLTDIESKLLDAGVRVTLKICNLSRALGIINAANLVLTGDTGIKHLASSTSTPIVELSIGSSDFRFTGAYTENAYILQSAVGCAPCVHSQPCHIGRHICAESILPSHVSSVCLAILENKTPNVDLPIFRGGFLPGGMWCAQKVNPSDESMLGSLMEESKYEL